MGLMNWSAELDVGVDEMNHQHQNLLDLMNVLHDKWKKKEMQSQLADALNKLKFATLDHFKEEEEFQEQIKWEKRDTHKIIHQRLIESFLKHEEDFKKTGELTEDFFNFLQFWLSSHIQGIDKEYGNFANKKSA